MDFDLTDEHEAVVDLARTILGEHATPARLTELEAADWLDRDAWRALAAAGLLGVALPASRGGAGLGMVGVHLLLEAVGRTVAHVPAWETQLAALALAHAGDDHEELLGEVVAGSRFLTVALQEAGAVPERPSTRARTTGDGIVLAGTKTLVPAAQLASHAVVVATDEDQRPALYLVALDGAVVVEQQLSTDVPHARVTLDDTPGVALALPDGVTWLRERATAGLASLQAGMCHAAVRLAADHTSTREQFGRPLATFQAVSQRVATAFIEAECARLTALQAAWRLDAGRPAADEVAIAKWWAAEAGHRVLHAAQHVHGGVGVDRDYPLHRYLLRTKQVEFALGSGLEQLTRLGAALAAEPA